MRARRHDGATNRAEKWAPLASSLSLALPVGLACETDRGKERERERDEKEEKGGGSVASCAGNGRPKAARYSRACVRACLLACVLSLSFPPPLSVGWVRVARVRAYIYVEGGQDGRGPRVEVYAW